MDQAWEIEEDFWRAGTSGGVPDYYARVLTSDAYVVRPEGVLGREDLLREWDGRAAWAGYTISERQDRLVDGETVLLTYRVEARTAGPPDGPGAPDSDYRAYVSSVYTWVGAGWALVFRQHSPAADAPA